MYELVDVNQFDSHVFIPLGGPVLIPRLRFHSTTSGDGPECQL